MRYEVEMKFAVADMAALESKLVRCGVTIGQPQTELDIYFSHPARDFAQTDEALRVRRKGQAVFVTYKGPKIDPQTKTRHEIDLPLPPGEETAQAWIEMLTVLGFGIVGEVRKSRRKAAIAWQGRSVEGSLDEIEGLGTFVELELIAEANDLDTARANIASLAAELGLAGSERRSYLELLLTKRTQRC